MANITVTANTPAINVTSTPTTISVTDGSGINQTITTTKSNVTVTSSQSNVTVGGLTTVANSVLRAAVSAVDAGGDGSFTYSNTTGVFTYTGPSASEVRAHLSNTSPIQYSSSTGVIGIDSNALFTGKTTDDLVEGSTNLYLNGSGTTDDLAEGIINLYYTQDRANSAANTAITTYFANSSNYPFTLGGDINVGGNITTTGDSQNYILLDDDRLGTNTLTLSSIQNVEIGLQRNGGTGAAFRVVSDVDPSDSNRFIAFGVSQDGDVGIKRHITLTGTTVGGAPNTSYIKSSSINEGNVINMQTGAIVMSSFAGNVNITQGDEDFRRTSGKDLGMFLTSEGNIGIRIEATGSGNVVTTSSGRIENRGQVVNTANTLLQGDLHIENDRQIRAINLNGTLTGNYIDLDEDDISQNSLVMSSGDDVVIAINNGTGADAPYKFKIVSGDSKLPGRVDLLEVQAAQGNVIMKGTGHLLTNHLTPKNDGNIEVHGNLNVSGNINYVNVTDLLVDDQSITLNYGNVAQDAFIYVDRTGATATNAHIKWNETGDQWEIYDGTTTYKIPTSTDDLAEGSTNLYYSNSLVNAFIQTNITTSDITEGTNLYWTTDRGNTNSDAWLTTKSTTDLAEGTNLYYTDARANSAFDARLIDTGIQKKAHTVFVQDLALSPDAANATLGFYLPNGSGTTGQVLKFDSATQLTQAFLDTGNVTETTNLYYTDARANSAIDAYVTGGNAISVSSGVVSLDNTAVTPKTYGDAANVPQFTVDQQGRITGVSNVAITGTYANADVQNFLENGYSAANIDANDIVAVTFTGDGSDLTSVRAETIEITIKNADTVTIPKGYPVHAIGTGPGGEANVVLADAGNADLMPAHFIALEELTNPGDSGRGLLSGLITGVDTSSFTAGDVIYVAVGGGYANVAPSGEANLIQNLGVVTDVAVSGKGEVFGAGRAAATPNLNNGNIFIGNGSNQAVSAVLDTSIVPENGNLYYTDARVQSNTAADTGLVHTTGTETVGGAKSFTSAMTVTPSVTVGGDITNAEIGIKEFHTPSALAQMAGGGLLRTTYGRGTEASPVYGKDGDLTFRFIGVGYREGPAATTGGVFGFQQDGGNVSGVVPMAAIFRNSAEYTGFSHTGLDTNNKSNVYLTEAFASKGSTAHVTDTLIIGNHDAKQDTPATANLTIGHTDVDETEGRSIYLWLAAGSGIQSYFGAYNFTSTGVPAINSDTVVIAMNAMPRHKAGTIDSGSDTSTYAGSTWVGDYLADGTAVTINGSPTDNAANADGQTYYTKALAEIDWAYFSKNGLVAYALYTDSALTTPLVWGSGGLNASGTPGADGNDYSGWADIQFTGGDFTKKIPTGQTTTTGSGTGAEFFVSKKGTSYTSVGSNHTNGVANWYNRVGINQLPMAKGSGYAVNDTVEIDGSYLGGQSGTHNLTFTIDSVDGGGGVTSVGNVSGTAYDPATSTWSFEKEYISDTLRVKHNGTEKASFTTSGVALKQFNETVVALGNQSGNVSANIDAVNGSIFTMTAVDTITINSIPNAQPGSSYTLKITQDGTGSRTLSSSFKYLGGNATLSTGAGNIDVISVVYDGTDYLASLSHDYK